MSDPRVAVGLAVRDMEATRMEGESEYARLSSEMDGTLRGSGKIWLEDAEELYICDFKISFSRLSLSFSYRRYSISSDCTAL